MSHITINGNVTGANAHIGDKNYYSNPKDFYQSTPAITYTQLEQDLVAIIFENAPSIEEQQQILQSLRTIKENEGSEGHESSNKQNSSRIMEFLKVVGTGAAAKAIVELAEKWYDAVQQ